MINAQDIKNGTCIRLDGKLYYCIEFLHVKPGKGNTFMRTKLKEVVSGRVLDRRFNIGEKLEDVRVERRPFQFSYNEGDHYHFLNQETWDDVTIDKDLITGVDFLKEGMVIEVVSDASTETVLFAFAKAYIIRRNKKNSWIFGKTVDESRGLCYSIQAR